MTEPLPPPEPDPSYSQGRISLSLGFGLGMFLIMVPVAFLWLLAFLRVPQPPAQVALQRSIPCFLLALAGLSLDAAALKVFLSLGRGTQMPFTPTLQLVTAGPFRFTRNPILLGVSLYYLGIAALPYGWPLGSVVGAASLVGGGLYYWIFEEPRLEARFGEPYRAYRRRTPFLIPSLRIRP